MLFRRGVARVLRAQDRPAQALALLGRLHAAATAQGRTASVIERPTAPRPCVLVLFGVTGDLASKKLLPAIYDLANRGLLPPGFSLVGFARRDWEDEDFARLTHDAIKAHARTPFREAVWEQVCEGVRFVPGEFADDEAFDRLARTVADLDAERGTGANYAFYLSVPPKAFPQVVRQLKRSGIDPQLAAVDQALAARGAMTPTQSVQALGESLNSHMRHEENEALPLVETFLGAEGWAAFERAIRKTQGLRAGAEYLRWLLDGAPIATQAKVLALLPHRSGCSTAGSGHRGTGAFPDGTALSAVERTAHGLPQTIQTGPGHPVGP